MAASKQASKHAHTHAQCSNTSVGLAQMACMFTYLELCTNCVTAVHVLKYGTAATCCALLTELVPGVLIQCNKP